MLRDKLYLYKLLLKYREVELKKVLELTHISMNKLETYLDELRNIIVVKDNIIVLKKPLDLAIKTLNMGASIREVSEFLDWRDFEKLSGEILELNNYVVCSNFKATKPVRFEIDVIGVDTVSGRGIFIDCKHWSRGGSARNLVSTAEQHYERILKFVKHYTWFRDKWKYFNNIKEAVPLVVTLTTPVLRMHRGTLIVSIQELNNFLLDLSFILETYGVKPIVLRTGAQ